ncbi:cupin domain-containing protein [Paraburkholderia sp. 2C]
MKTIKTAFAASVAAFAVLCAPPSAHAHGADSVQETIKPAFQTPIANVPGKTMTALVVDYKPGGKSLPHRHGEAFVVAYVLQGEIRSAVNGGEPRVYHAGESWTEAPGDHHTDSENASSTKPAKLLAIFVAAADDKNLVIWDKK